MQYIKKRDGRLVEFNRNKVVEAIHPSVAYSDMILFVITFVLAW